MKKVFLLLLVALLLASILPGSLAMAVERGVYYEIFVRAFADSDGDGIGDFPGLTKKLDYLSDLGVKGLWLMPVFPSPSYHGYDVTDYRGINPEYGTMEEFQAFLAAAHGRGMKVLLDIPFNHTSWEHPWFVQSKNPAGDKRQWYHWAVEGDAGVNLSQQVWGGSVWKKSGGAWYYAIFWEGMPDLNFDTPAVREEVIAIARYWLDMGVDGFRLDAVSHIYGEGETSFAQDTARSADWWIEFLAAVKQTHPNAYIIGEAWESLEKRATLSKGLDSALNFDVGEAIIALLKTGGAGKTYVQRLERAYDAYGEIKADYIDAPFLTNHDQNRVYAMAGGKLERAKMAAAMLLTLPGNPIVYYGEEIGMLGAKPDEELRTPMLWGGGDPMQTAWRESRYNKNTKTVAEQETDPDSLLSRYRELIALRNAHPALLEGKLAAFDAENPIPAAYTMEGGGEKLHVLHNFTPKEQAAVVPKGLATVYQSEEMVVVEGKVTMPPYSTLVLGE